MSKHTLPDTELSDLREAHTELREKRDADRVLAGQQRTLSKHASLIAIPSAPITENIRKVALINGYEPSMWVA